MILAHIHVQFWQLRKMRPEWSRQISGIGHMPNLENDQVHKCVNAHAGVKPIKSAELESLLRNAHRDWSALRYLQRVSLSRDDSRSLWAGRLLRRYNRSKGL